MSAIMARRPQKSHTPAPAGSHHAVCCDVQNLGLVQGSFGPKNKIRIVWQLPQIDEATGKRFEAARLYNLSLHERAALRKDLERWRGRKFTEQELDLGFDCEKLIGVNCTLSLTQDVGDDGTTYANVDMVQPAPRGVLKLFPLEFTRLKDRQQRSAAPVAQNGGDDEPAF